jgi:redox-sensitive bicupin YhaK (pirin superfamily)
MSGPVTTQDADPVIQATPPHSTTVELTDSRQTQVGAFGIRRALPRRGRRTVGAWCFVDHMGPAEVSVDGDFGIAPHPHMGLQTVTWLLAGELVHRDSLGVEQVIRPGQLNLMSAGIGVVHSEERTGRYAGKMHGVQLWVAQPAATRDGPAAFEHHGELPKLEMAASVATVLVGELEGATSAGRRDTDHVGVDLDLRGPPIVVPLHAGWEYALVAFTGAVLVDDQVVVPGKLAYLGTGRQECRLSTNEASRALLFGGVPFEEPILMWWNFVARTQDEISSAYQDWKALDPRFGPVDSVLPRIEVGPPPWTNQRG